MKITIIGTGYVGLTSALCFANVGHQVLCLDNDQNKIQKLQNKIPTIFENRLEEMLSKALDSKNIEFTTDFSKAINFSNIIILAVGTPQNEISGEADLTYIHQAINSAKKYINEDKIFITKSTVPVGTNHQIQKILQENCPHQIHIASNPEFMREGFAIDDFMKPDRIVLGIDHKNCQEPLNQLYQFWLNQNYPILYTDITTAELIKYASNAFLMTKICFINEMEELASKLQANIQDLSLGMGLDHRIGKAFLNPGPGIGGSCFPKDSMALKFIAKENDLELSIINQVIDSNYLRFKKMAEKIKKFFDKKEIAVLGLAFKAGTDDVRMSPAIEIIKYLLADDFKIFAYDPKAIENTQKILGDKIIYCQNLAQCFVKSQNIVILTEWQEFKQIKDFPEFDNKQILDLRYIL